jgi:hypothetical protein
MFSAKKKPRRKLSGGTLCVTEGTFSAGLVYAWSFNLLKRGSALGTGLSEG